MKEKIYKAVAFSVPAGIVLFPLVTLAQNVSTVNSWFSNIEDWVTRAVPILIGVALLVFIWGLIQYINAGDDDAKKKGARGTIIYGVIILAAIVGVWGLVNFVLDTIGVDTGTTVPTPGIPGISG